MRGLHGTLAQSHSAGERVRVMAAGSGPTYLPTGTLLDEIGANIARAVDAVGADTAYFDGLGAVLPVVSGGATERFACSRMQLAFWRSCKRQVIAQADTEGEPELESGHLWHMDSRSGQSDFAATDSKAFFDGVKLFSVRSAKRELFTPDLGWWGYLPFTQSAWATTPDEVSYMASRAAGYGGSPALETEFDKLGANGRTDEALAGMAPWGRLILPDSAKALLFNPNTSNNTDFELVQNSTGWYIRRVQYHTRHVANLGQPASCTWRFQAAFYRSTIGVRMRALPGIVAAGSPDDIDLLALGSSKVNDVSRTIGCHGHVGAVMPGMNPPYQQQQPISTLTNTGVPIFMNASVEAAPAGAPGGIVRAMRLNYSANGGLTNTSDSVGCVQNLFKQPHNLTLNRPLSATVFGDGSAAVVDVQLCASGGTTCVHFFVAVNHTGWRVVALPMPETRKLFDQMQLCAVNGDMVCITAMRGFTWSAVAEVNLLVTAAPKANVFIGRVVAHRELPANLTAATTFVTVGTQRLSLPMTLRAKPCPPATPGMPACATGEGCADYIECTALSDATSCRAFDATNHRLPDAALRPAGPATGAARTAAKDGGVLVVTVGTDAADASRAEVTIIERATELLGPFAARPLKTDDDEPAPAPLRLRALWIMPWTEECQSYSSLPAPST